MNSYDKLFSIIAKSLIRLAGSKMTMYEVAKQSGVSIPVQHRLQQVPIAGSAESLCRLLDMCFRLYPVDCLVLLRELEKVLAGMKVER